MSMIQHEIHLSVIKKVTLSTEVITLLIIHVENKAWQSWYNKCKKLYPTPPLNRILWYGKKPVDTQNSKMLLGLPHKS